ncbi:MAG: asparagine synthase (glutamine-hydrolyzing), partial [Acidobacteriota bacterium]
MCGIAGLMRPDGDAVGGPGRVKAMAERLRHRGPDAAGEWIGGAVAFGFRRLAIIDLDGGDQPMVDGPLTVMQNGEIYNYLELRRELEGLGHRFRTRSDTEVLLQAYRAWGVVMLGRLRGMFAVALYDGERRRLLLARDRLGQKPLFWSHDPARGELSFASGLDALLPALAERHLDEVALDDFLTFSVVPGPSSILRGVSKLPPAHYLVAENGRVGEPRRYWRPPPPAVGKLDEAEAAEGLRRELETSVDIRLRSDVPVGCFLSGGVDSTLVTGLAARRKPGLSSFTIGFGDPRFDESAVARRTAERFGTRHRGESVDASTFSPDGLQALVRFMDEPFGDSSFLPTYWLSRAARRHVTVALSGDGGDELFAGYTRYRTFRRLERLARVPSVGLAAAERLLRPFHRRLAKASRLARRDALGRILGLLTYFEDTDKKGLLGADLRGALGGRTSRETLARQFDDLPRGLSGLDRFLQRDLATSLVDDALVKVDRASMAASLEVRSPLLDHRVVERALEIPAAVKLRGRSSKAILKRATADLLPEEVRRGAKRGFEVPFGAWFARAEWREWLTSILDPATIRRQGLFEAGA